MIKLEILKLIEQLNGKNNVYYRMYLWFIYFFFIYFKIKQLVVLKINNVSIVGDESNALYYSKFLGYIYYK